MFARSQRSGRRDVALSTLDGFIQVLSVSKDTCGVPPAQIALGSACVPLTTIKNTMDNKDDYIDLGLACADVCEALDRGLNGKKSAGIGEPVHKAIEKLTTTIANVQRRIDEKNKRNAFSRAFHAQSDKDAIAAWKQDFLRILQIFNTELHLNVLVGFEDLRQDLSAIREGLFPQRHISHSSIHVGELPPPAPKAFFGRENLIEEIVSHAENLESVALVGTGGIGKTSIALTVLHDQRIKDLFGDNRRFISCNKFSASRANFLAQLSKVVGSSIENPEGLDSLQPLLSSRKIILFLDNAESILDPQGADSQEIYAMVKELIGFSNICLGITSRTSTIPPHCKRPKIPTLSLEASCEIFYEICDNGGRSDVVSDLVRQLDFHALSIALLATAASHNAWDYDRLAQEWNERRGRLLRTDYNESLAATIELSLASPTFRNLRSDARELLRVTAFFPQGIHENNLNWLFPSIPSRRDIFDKFCILSLTSRSNGFITMLAPIRDYFCPEDPSSSPLLLATRDHYFTRLSVDVYPDKPGFTEARWIVSEDVNVEHLLNVFTNSDDAWDICSHFMEHLYWFKPRQTVLGPKIEGLPDDHPCKPKTLFRLSWLVGRLGNPAKQKQLIAYTLTSERERGHYTQVAKALLYLSDANRCLGFFREGILQAEEALEIYEQLGDTAGQADSLNFLAYVLFEDHQLDAAEHTAFRAINLASVNGQKLIFCRSHRYLGLIYESKGEKAKAIRHLEIALKTASPFNWQDQLFWNHWALAWLFHNENRLGDANAHVQQAKSHAGDHTYYLGRAMDTQASIWHSEGRFEDAKSEISHALEVFEKLGAAEDGGRCSALLKKWGKQ